MQRSTRVTTLSAVLLTGGLALGGAACEAEEGAPPDETPGILDPATEPPDPLISPTPTP